jgi:nucleoid-associated protein YgaU
MREFAKYFLALAVMGTGFYVAQQYRRTERPATSDAVASHKETAEFPPTGSKRTTEVKSADALPVAALADVDRIPLLGPDRASAQGKPNSTGANSVTKQPTLRADKPAADPAAAESGKTPVAGATGRDEKKQAGAKPSPKKQEKKKNATAKSPAVSQDAVPPEFARDYRPHFEVDETGSNRAAARETRPDSGKTHRSSQASAQATERQRPAATGPRRHRIVEGDTLRRLAEQYLGSQDRYLSIFQANPDVLFDSRLIPIGVEIVIPNRTTVVAKAADGPTATVTAGNSDAAKSDDLEDRSVAVPGTASN